VVVPRSSSARRAAAFALATLLGVAGAAVAGEIASRPEAGQKPDRETPAKTPGLPSSPPPPRSEPAPAPADLATILKAIREPGASAVLVNVWATWCDPCREEMPGVVRFYRSHRAEGLRLLLVSADDPESAREVAGFLGQVGAAGASAFIKTGDDMAFINGLDARWSGALPASFLFDGRGRERHFWPGQVTYRDLEDGLKELAGRPGDATDRGAIKRDATSPTPRGHP
jgi:thiol-disulfide isomerase/thioredoxin